MAKYRSMAFICAGFVGVVTAAVAVAFVWIDTDQGWLLLAASGIALAASQLERITEISAGGASAKLQEKIREADEAVEHVRALAATLVRPTMKMAVRLGRWDSGLSRQETHELKVQVENTLRALGTPDEDILEAVHDYYVYTLFDMSRAFMGAVKAALDEKVKVFFQKTQGFVGPISDISTYNRVVEEWRSAGIQRDTVLRLGEFDSIERLRSEFEATLENCPLLSSIEHEQLLKDIRRELEAFYYFADHKKHRDLARWVAIDSGSVG
jgi:hypothetical protein